MKHRKSLIIALICLIGACTAAFAACGKENNKPNGTDSGVQQEESYVPVLTLSDTDVYLVQGDEYCVNASVLKEGVTVSGTFDYSWTLCDEAEEDVVSVTKTAYGGKITALKAGTTSYTVSVAVHGYEVAKQINIHVVAAAISFVAEGMTPVSGGYALDLATIDIQEHKSTVTPSIRVYENGVEDETPAINWESDNTNAVVVESGAFKAVHKGNAVLTGTYKEAEIKVYVNVTFPEITPDYTLARQDMYVGTSKTLDLSSYGTYTSLTVIYNGATLQTVNAGSITVADPAVLNIHGDDKLIVVASDANDQKTSFSVPVFVIDKVITSTEVNGDEGRLRSILTQNKDKCVVLGDDIVLTGNKRLLLVTDFSGTFDGMGHSISHAILTYNNTAYESFYYPTWFFASSGVIRNLHVQLDDVVMKAGEGRCSLVKTNTGVVENVFVEATVKKDSTFISATTLAPAGSANSILVSTNAAAGTIRNCVVKLSLEGFPMNAQGHPELKRIAGIIANENTGTIENCYAISDKIPAFGTVENSFNVVGDLKGKIENVGVYGKMGDFIKNTDLTANGWNKSLFDSYAPEVVLSTSALTLKVGRSEAVTASLTVDGETVSGVNFTWTAADGANTYVTYNNLLRRFTGKAIGSTYYTVSATLGNYTASARLDIQVMEAVYTFEIAGMEKEGNVIKGQMSAFAFNTLQQTITPSVTVLRDGEAITPTEAITWSTDDATIVEINGSGAFVAHKKGTATLTGTYLDKHFTVEITVIDPSLDLVSLQQAGQAFGTSVTTATLPIPSGYTLKAVYRNGAQVGTTLSVALSGHGDYSFVLVAAKDGTDYCISAPVVVYDYKFDATTNGGWFGQFFSTQYDNHPYIALTQDLTVTTNVTLGNIPDSHAADFSASRVFDGMGHTITLALTYSAGAKSSWNPSFILNNYGVIRNVKFVITAIDSTAGSGRISLIRNNYGTVENVCVTYTAVRSDLAQKSKASLLVSQNAGIIRNCVAVVDAVASVDNTGSDGNYILWTAAQAQALAGLPQVGSSFAIFAYNNAIDSASGTVENCYVISEKVKQFNAADNTSTNTFHPVVVATEGTVNGCHVYATAAELTAAQNLATGNWVGAYWSAWIS